LAKPVEPAELLVELWIRPLLEAVIVVPSEVVVLLPDHVAALSLAAEPPPE